MEWEARGKSFFLLQYLPYCFSHILTVFYLKWHFSCQVDALDSRFSAIWVKRFVGFWWSWKKLAPSGEAVTGSQCPSDYAPTHCFDAWVNSYNEPIDMYGHQLGEFALWEKKGMDFLPYTLAIETLRLRFGHRTANGKPRFSISGFTLAVCPYLGLKIRGWYGCCPKVIRGSMCLLDFIDYLMRAEH